MLRSRAVRCEILVAAQYSSPIGAQQYISPRWGLIKLYLIERWASPTATNILHLRRKAA